ncbi:MAG: efflux RND transporter periplasmic adaptor subunit [Acidobacteriota bacterium]
MSYRSLLPSLAVAATAMTFLGCGEAPQPAPSEPRPVRLIEARVADDVIDRTFSGRVRAPVRARLSFRVPGRIVERPADIGRLLERGALIARLDPSDYRLRLDEAEAALAEAEADAAQARSEAARARALYAGDNLSQADLDRALAVLAATASQVDAARERRTIARRELSYTRLEAPGRGLVADTFAETGENVQAGATVVAFATVNEPLEIEWTVPESMIGGLRPGQQVAATFPAVPGLIKRATVVDVGAAPRVGQATFPVVASLTDQELRLRPGMAAEIVLALAPDAAALGAPTDGATGRVLVPSQAVIADPRGSSVFVVEPASSGDALIVRRRPVQVGSLRPDGLEVLQGLVAGERVVAAGATQVQDGQRVRELNATMLGELPSTELGQVEWSAER